MSGWETEGDLFSLLTKIKVLIIANNSNGCGFVNGQELTMGLLSAKACQLDRQRLEITRVRRYREALREALRRRSVRQQQRQQCGFRMVKSAQDALRTAWIATWVRRMCREAMGKMITSPAAE